MVFPGCDYRETGLKERSLISFNPHIGFFCNIENLAPEAD